MRVSSIVPAHRLAQYDIVNASGEDLGQVQEFLLDVSQGRIAFVVVAFGGVLGISDKWFALPWEILAWSPENRKFIVNMTREILEKAPGLDKRRWPEEIDISWLRTCYVHFGCEPYREEIMVTEDNIRKLAYSMWENEGRPEGKHLEHWYRAEQIVKERAAAPARPQPQMISSIDSQAYRLKRRNR